MSVSKNYVYNVLYQLLSVIIPLITIPYISRILGSYGIGVASFTRSIVQYFILFGTLGISLYGIRSIAYVRDDIKKRSQIFQEIFLFKLITTTISYITFFIIIYYSDSKYKTIYLIQSINILSAAIDISWLFMGLEEFGKTVSRNAFVKITSVFLIFLLIKNSNDIWIYVLISSLGNFLGQLSIWLYLPRYIKFQKNITFKNVFRHFYPNLKLFIPQIAIQIYVVLDKTMIGLLANEYEVGLYTVSQRINKVLLLFVTSLGTVMLPKISNLFSKNDYSSIKKYIVKSFDFSNYLALPLMFGIVGISNGFVFWFFGKGFSKASILISMMSPIILFISWGTTIGSQLMLTTKKEKEYTLAVSLGAATNFILNILLIPKIQSNGAAIATVIAEFVVSMAQMFKMRNVLDFKSMFKNFWKYLLSGLIMLAVIRSLELFIEKSILLTISQIFIALIIYYVLMEIFKTETHIYLKNKVKLILIKHFKKS